MRGRRRAGGGAFYGVTIGAALLFPLPDCPAMSEKNSPNAADSLIELRDLIRQFSGERDWNQFHTPKNLAMALSVEVAELVEHFQWLPTDADVELDERKRTGIRHELADVLVYLIQLADKTNVDLRSAVLEKMELNRQKYPLEQVKGDARKYTEY
jgi:NTP pyrophosphatase (non-canonical NTP hydrolase)